MKALRVLAILLVTLLVLLVVTDRVGVRVAQNEAAKKLQTSQHLSAKPKVTIEGIPFLTQAIHRRLKSVRIQASNLVVENGGRSVRISNIDAYLKNVIASQDLSSGTAQSGSGTAEISYQDLSTAIGVPVSYGGAGSDGQGRVKATKSLSLLGATVSASVTATVQVKDANTVSFGSPIVTASGVTLPSNISAQLASVFGKPISLGSLPVGLTVQSVSASASGVTVALRAKNVKLG